MHKQVIRILSCFILNKRTRETFRDKYSNAPLKMILKNKNIVNNGKNNKFILHLSNGRIVKNPIIPGLKVVFEGNNNVCELYAPVPKFTNANISMGDNSSFIICNSPHFVKNLQVWRMRNNSVIEIGSNFSCEGVIIAMDGEDNLKLKIGDDCMFSRSIDILCSDIHCIIDTNTMEATNLGGDISIGDHVWICPNVSILKNVTIPNNCIIGSNTKCIKSLNEEKSLYVGLPAIKIRGNVTWERCSAQDYMRFKCQKQ